MIIPDGEVPLADVPQTGDISLLWAVLTLYQPLREKAMTFLRRHMGDRGIARKLSNARFAQALSMGFAGGLPLEEAMELARKLLSDTPGAEKRCRRCAEEMEKGTAMTDAMTAAELLPPAQSRLLNLGLKGGSADRVMAQIADTMGEDAENALDTAISRVEPAMVMTASVLVGVILLSVMLPLMNIMSSLG